MSCVLLAQASQAVAQGPDTSLPMDLFEFLGSWNDGEGNDIDPMLLDTLTDLDSPIDDRIEDRPHVEDREGDAVGYGEDAHVDRDMPGHDDE